MSGAEDGVGRGSLGVAGGLALLAFMAADARVACAEAPLEALSVDTATGPHRFKVEVMRTEPERERGLMFRKTMSRDHGMLFEYQTEQPVTFWMHNTYLPLDLIFIAKDGRVVNVAHDAKPMDDSLIPSAGAALGVLELDAGTAKAIDLKAGDRVHHKMFGDATR